ncbi:MAG: DNA-processing protein DprA [Lachnospiraceae bacterium]|nr:DNA-processing protein DprA [Lachnospiraceae bacterium]
MDEFIASQNLELTKRDLEWLDRNGKEQNIRVIFDTDEDYPMRLQAIPDRPFGLYVKGRLPEDDLPSIAMVGARDATPYGIEAAKYFSRELAEMGVQIISGLARGIDSCSHKGALQCPYGSTFAVLGSGIDVVYPRTNRYIYDQMAEQGGVISEYLPGTQPLRYNFPNRNRIISGLSDGVFIIEARKKSGTMITADQATEQGKDVFCLPGRYYDSLNFGCMDLINNGAKLVYEPRQIFDEIGAGEQLSLALSQVRSASELGPALPPDSPESYLLKFLSNEPHDIDYLVAKSHMSVTQVLTTLTNLEILGIAMTQDRRHFSIKTR